MTDPKIEIERLHKWIEQLLAGKTLNCVFCGHDLTPDPVAREPQAKRLQRHMVECQAHPMRHLLESARGAESYLTMLQPDRYKDQGLRDVLSGLRAAIAAATGAEGGKS